MDEQATKKLIENLYKQAIGVTPGKRLRLAVTSLEYILIEKLMLKQEGRFHGRIGNAKLIIESDPDNDGLHVQY